MAKVLSGEKNSDFNDKLDEFKRQVQHGTISYRDAMGALYRINNCNALSRDAADIITDSEFFNGFGPIEAIISANILYLNGLVVNLEPKNQLAAVLRILPDQVKGTKRATFTDFIGLRDRLIKHNVSVSWWSESTNLSDLTIDGVPEDHGLTGWPWAFERRIAKLAVLLEKSKHTVAIWTSDGTMLTA